MTAADLPYRHTQPGWVIRWSLGGAAVLCAVLAAAVPAEGRVVAGVVAVVLCAAFVLMHSLTVDVDDERVLAAFGPGLVRRRIAVADLRDARAVRNRWFYGWGVRLTPHGWMFNVSGMRAVELEFESGRRFRIGTDEPDELAAAVRAAIAHRTDPGTGRR